MSAKLSQQERDKLEAELVNYRRTMRQEPPERQAGHSAQKAARLSQEHRSTTRGDIPKAPCSAVKTQLRRTRRGKARRLLALILLVLLLLCLGGFCAWRYDKKHDPHAMDMEAFAGALPGKTETEIKADLNKIIQDGEFNVAMSSIVSIDGNKGKVNIENIAVNHYWMQVDLVYTDPATKKRTVIYQSGAIKPGYSIGEATMDATLPHTGDGAMTAYDAVATFHALDPETKREMGATQINIVLAYQNKTSEGE
ncbi:MAG: hypothetical protein RSD62_04520 [Ruthenibacterium sp.]